MSDYKNWFIAGLLLAYQEDYELRIARREIADDISKIKPIQALGGMHSFNK